MKNYSVLLLLIVCLLHDNRCLTIPPKIKAPQIITHALKLARNLQAGSLPSLSLNGSRGKRRAEKKSKEKDTKTKASTVVKKKKNIMAQIVDMIPPRTSMNFFFDKNKKSVVENGSDKNVVIGGLIQDAYNVEDAEKSKYDKVLIYFEKVRENMHKIVADIQADLDKGVLDTLHQHPFIEMILQESLKTLMTIDILQKSQMQHIQAYDTEWYQSSSIDTKRMVMENVYKQMAKLFSFSKKHLKTKNAADDSKVKNAVHHLLVELSTQKFVAQNVTTLQFLKHHMENSHLYEAPLYTDVISSIGSVYYSFYFEKIYKDLSHRPPGTFNVFFSKLKYKIQKLVEGGSVIVVDPNLEEALFNFKREVVALMLQDYGNKRKSKKAFGFINMCSKSCFQKTVEEKYELTEYEANFSETNTAQRRGDLTRNILFYFRYNIFSIETTADIILIALLFLKTANNLTAQGLLDISSTKATDRINLIKKSVPRVKRGSQNISKHLNDMTLYKFFREEEQDVTDKNKMIYSLKDIVNLTSLTKKTKEFSMLYEKTKALWRNIKSLYKASYGFVASRKLKTSSFVQSKIRNVGFVFRWLANEKQFKNNNFLTTHFSPLASLSLQLTFFLSSVVEEYESSFLGSFSAVIRKIFTLGKSGAHPRNFNDLVEFCKINYYLNYRKSDNAQRVISNMVRMFKMKFLSLPYTPVLFAQYVSLFLALWVFENEEQDISFANSNIDRMKKTFFLTYFVHGKGPVEKATEMIYDGCKKQTKKIVLGCVYDLGGVTQKNILGLKKKCKNIEVKVLKSSIRHVLKIIYSTLKDPTDIFKIAADMATRCEHFGRAEAERKNKKKKGETKNYDIFLKSELTLRYICAKETERLVRRMVKTVSRLKDMSQAHMKMQQIFNEIQYLKIKNLKDNSNLTTIICPYMKDNDPKIRDPERAQISIFVMNKLNIRQILKGKIYNFFKRKTKSITGDDLSSSISIKVGARRFNGYVYIGGFRLDLKDTSINEVHIQMSNNSRKVHDGKGFVSEFSILKKYGVVAINTEGIEKENLRIYKFSDGTEMNEYDYGVKFPTYEIIIWDGYNYVSSQLLKDIGMVNERVVWGGASVGWVAEFALNTISDKPVPVFNGEAWVLFESLTIANVLGPHLPIDVNRDLLATQVNFVVLNKDGKKMMEKETPTITLSHAVITLGGINNFIIKAVKGANNDIIIYTRLP